MKDQGYGVQQQKKEELKTMALAGSGIMNNNQAPGQKQYYGNYDTKGNANINNQGMGIGIGGHMPKQNDYGTVNKRGSEFKKSAQHILNR